MAALAVFASMFAPWGTVSTMLPKSGGVEMPPAPLPGIGSLTITGWSGWFGVFGVQVPIWTVLVFVVAAGGLAISRSSRTGRRPLGLVVALLSLVLLVCVLAIIVFGFGTGSTLGVGPFIAAVPVVALLAFGLPRNQDTRPT